MFPLKCNKNVYFRNLYNENLFDPMWAVNKPDLFCLKMIYRKTGRMRRKPWFQPKNSSSIIEFLFGVTVNWGWYDGTIVSIINKPLADSEAMLTQTIVISSQIFICLQLTVIDTCDADRVFFNQSQAMIGHYWPIKD